METTTSLAEDPATPQPSAQVPLSLYTLELAYPLPVLDLSRNVVRACFGERWDDRFLGIMRRHYGIISSFFRVGGVLFAVVLVVPAPLRNVLAIASVIVGTPAVICAFSMMSVDMIQRVSCQHEFIFNAFTSVTCWAMMGIIYDDVRSFSSLMGGSSAIISILSDALFRTARQSFKSTVVSLPIIAMMATMVYLHKVDQSNYLEFQIKHVRISITDIMVNTCVTNAIFNLRLIYRRRHMMKSLTSGLVACSIYRAKLKLQRVNLNDVQTVLNNGRVAIRKRSSVMFKKTQADRSLIYSQSTDAAHPHVQQVRLVPLKIVSIDATDSLGPQWTPTTSIANSYIWFHRVNGLIGLALSTTTMFLPTASAIELKVKAGEWSASDAAATKAIPVVGLLCTLVCTLPFVFSYQRTLFRSLLRNFDVLFIMSQFTAACVTLSDMLEFDYRSWAVLSWVLWFASVVLLDAVMPCVRRHFGVRKAHGSVVVLTLLGCMIYILSATFVSTATTLVDRIMFKWHVSETFVLTMHTQSFFLNRMIPIAAWSLRLLWEMLVCDEPELMFIKGNVEYFCPLEMFPVPKTRRVVVPTADAANAAPPAKQDFVPTSTSNQVDNAGDDERKESTP